ncbi:hypothetical protein ACFLTN_06940 [Chloroflexota bacterium]
MKKSLIMDMVEEMLAGDVLSLARLITKVERDGADVPQIMKQVYPHLGKAYCIGITGPPGATWNAATPTTGVSRSANAPPLRSSAARGLRSEASP